MKNKDIVLDFTSLLDVTLIIIFFFIMFGNIDSDNKAKQAMEEAEAVKAEAEITKEQAEQMLADAEQLTDKQLHILRLYLNTNMNGWSLDILTSDNAQWSDTFEGSAVKYSIHYQDDTQLDQEIRKYFESNGFTEDSIILCELLSDDSLSGTNTAHRSLDRVLGEIRKTYSTFYISKTDMSDYKEDDSNE